MFKFLLRVLSNAWVCVLLQQLEWKVTPGFHYAIFFLRQQMNCRVSSDLFICTKALFSQWLLVTCWPGVRNSLFEHHDDFASLFNSIPNFALLSPTCSVRGTVLCSRMLSEKWSIDMTASSVAVCWLFTINIQLLGGSQGDSFCS